MKKLITLNIFECERYFENLKSLMLFQPIIFHIRIETFSAINGMSSRNPINVRVMMINDFLNKREQLEGEVSSMCYKVALLLSSSCIHGKFDTMINELMILNQKR